MGRTDGGFAFLAIEDAGAAMTAEDFGHADKKAAAYALVKEVHSYGDAHLDLRRRHFRRDRSGKIRLIDFSHAQTPASHDMLDQDMALMENVISL